MRKKYLLGLVFLMVIVLVGCVGSEEEGEKVVEEKVVGEGSISDDAICGEMKFSEARELGKKGECGDLGTYKENAFCNENTRTWWIDLACYDEKEGCNPACVINMDTGEVEVNWRCMGLIQK